MNLRAKRVLAAVFVLAAGCSSPASPAGLAAGSGTASSSATEMVTLTNAERRRAGLMPFVTSPALMRAAQIQADQMASLGQIAHELPRARYPEPKDRIAAVGYQWLAYAENVAYGQVNPAAAVSSWMDSKGHRKNILSPFLTEIGTGVATGDDGRRYWVQVFGQPR
jgi:uncharacterized protein YkwD